jgi:hypothetical protein
MAREDREARPEQWLGESATRAVRDRERVEERIVGERVGAVRIVDGGGKLDRLALAYEPRAGAGELGPCGRGAPDRSEWELDERDDVEARRAQRGLDALDDVASGEALGERVAVRPAGKRCDEWDTRSEDCRVAQALRADRVGAEALGVGLLGDVDEADAELERFVKCAFDVARITSACGGGRESYIAAADDRYRCSGELSLSHDGDAIIG